MKITVDKYMMQEYFRSAGCDEYSSDGYEALLDYYDSIDEDMELDPVAIKCDCTEYGNDVGLNIDDFISEYAYLYPINEYFDDENIEPFDIKLCPEKFDKSAYVDALVDRLEERTTVLRVSDTNYIVFWF